MRALVPDPGALDLDLAYAVPGRRHVRANFVASADGAAELSGRTRLLGSPGDLRVFRVLRGHADVVLVGAGTARTENYGPVRLDDSRRARRRDHGMADLPPLAVVSRSLTFDPQAPLLSGDGPRPILLTTEQATASSRLRDVADIVRVGTSEVDLPAALDELGNRGLRHVLCEGGPTLFAQLAAAGLVDELCLTMAPLLGGPDRARIVAGTPFPDAQRLTLEHVLEEDGFLFLRFGVSRRSAP